MGLGYLYAHDGDGASGAESDHRVGVLHQVRQDLAALAGECLHLLPGEVRGFGGELLEFGPEVFVLPPSVKCALADAGLLGGLGSGWERRRGWVGPGPGDG